MPRPSNQSGLHPTGHSLNTFVNSQDESPVEIRLARDSTLPRSSLHQNPSYRGIDPASAGTSRSVNRDRSTHLESVPTLDSTGQTLPSASEPTTGDAVSDCGIGAVIEGQNRGPILDREMHDFLHNQVDVHVQDIRSIPRREPAMLECPFNRLGCNQCFSFDMEREWIAHSLDHYMKDDSGFDRAEPPQRNQCPFCLESFVNVNGETSWVERMKHVSMHHRRGHSMARDARTDFELYSYLWRKGAITIEEFRDVCGPRAYPSYGTRSQAPGATTPRAAAGTGPGVQGPEEAFSVIERRRRRHRPRR